MLQKYITFSLLTLFICCLYCCRSDRKKQNEPQPIDFIVLKRSPLFNDKNIALTLDSVDNMIFIKLDIKGNRKFPFPLEPKNHDTLFKTVFNFNFYNHNRLILSDYNKLHNRSWNPDTTASSENFSFSSDTIDLRLANLIKFQIPLYAFHNLKNGKQTIELDISQTVFSDEISNLKSNISPYTHVYVVKPLLNSRVKFNINVPKIYKSIVYGYGLELKNDSTFSPGGMDNTIWKSSYPDIYWMIYYPTGEYYTKTTYETSTDKYTAHDTFNLYHYYLNDSIDIGVYDHDNLSRDDGLGYWTGPLARLSRSPINRITFGNVKAFDVKVVGKGVTN